MISWKQPLLLLSRQPRARWAVDGHMSLSVTFPAGMTSLRWLEGSDLQATQQATRALEQFLADVERRAFRIAQIALRHEEDALDAVQEAMLKLVKNYSARPAAEWKPLFYRILGNCVRDAQRRRRTRGRVFTWIGGRDDGEEPGEDPIEQAPDGAPLPPESVQADGAMAALEQALGALPTRQREAFLLRALEGLDVAATASAMGCSEGSVKTHYFRALQSLRLQLGEHWS
jgi:RNA polymerase sigma-70 factor (ECF subfamily)